MFFCWAKRVYSESVPIDLKSEFGLDLNFLRVIQDLRFYLFVGPESHILARLNCKLGCDWDGVEALFWARWPVPGTTEGRPWMGSIACSAYEVALSYLHI